MFSKKKSKVKKMRGSSSHGWGHKKKHRGAGNRGGKGNAGTGARGDSKKSSILVKFGSKYFGKRGFNALKKKETKVLSIRDIEENFDKMVDSGFIEKKGTTFTLDLTKTKYEKILGRSKFSKKLDVKCEQISASAKVNIEKAGGKVEVLGETKEEPAKAEAQKE